MSHWRTHEYQTGEIHSVSPSAFGNKTLNLAKARDQEGQEPRCNVAHEHVKDTKYQTT